MSTVVIYGPPASGKTRYAQEFRDLYRCKRIFDEGKERPLSSFPVQGSLILTQLSPQEIKHWQLRAVPVGQADSLIFIPIHDALTDLREMTQP